MMRKFLINIISGSGSTSESELPNSAELHLYYRQYGGILNLIRYALALCLELSDECGYEDIDYLGQEESPHDRDIS